MNNKYYIAVNWANIQDLINEDWFASEAVLDVSEKLGRGVYFVPVVRYNAFYEDKEPKADYWYV